MNDKTYYCVNQNGEDYPYRPSGAGDPNPRRVENEQIVPSADRGSDKVTGGGALGNIRLMLSLDYAVSPNVLVGTRLGFILNRYPGLAAGVDGRRFDLPLHAELRFTYVFGKEGIYKPGLAPFAFAGAGLSTFETKIAVKVVEAPPGGARTQKDVDAWHLAGPGFVALGGGLRYAFSPAAAAMLGLRANVAFGDSFAPSFGPELGVQLGF